MTHTEYITFKNVDMVVTFEYQPEEPEVTYYRDGSGYPGCAEEFNIISVTINKQDASELMEPYYEEIEAYIRWKA